MEFMPALRGELDELKPSLFEILAENQLSALLAPSLRYLLAVAAHRRPRYLLRALNSFDELYALLGLLVERYCLTTFAASFTENFYGLKRERLPRTRAAESPRAQLAAPAALRHALRLRGADVWKNLAVLVGVPYLRRKLDEAYDVQIAPSAALAGSGAGGYRRDEDALPPRPTARQRLAHLYKWFLRNVYPSLNGAYHFAALAFSLAYLFDNTKYASPLLWLAGVRLRRLGAADHAAIEAALNPPSTATSPTPTAATAAARWRALLRKETLRGPLLRALRGLLPAAIFALKFLEWWHASDFSRQLARKASEAVDLPPPVVAGLPVPAPVSAAAQSKPKTQRGRKAQAASGEADSSTQDGARQRAPPPVSATTRLPIFTVPYPPPNASSAGSTCPICLDALTAPTACQTGFVFCYACVHRWLNGEHDRQEQFMRGGRAAVGAPWEEDDRALVAVGVREEGEGEEGREGRWESGRGRCPVTGRRVLGGSDGLRRVLV